MNDRREPWSSAVGAIESGDWQRLWQPLPAIALLNHGSYGRTLVAVRESQRLWDAEIDTDPAKFYRFRHDAELRRAADAVAMWLGASGTSALAFSHNASTAVLDAVLALAKPGDKVQYSSLGYGGVEIGLRHLADSFGIELHRVDIGSLSAAGDFEALLLEAASTVRPSVLVLDQITSATALRLPVESILKGLRRVSPDTRVIVDAAHAAGMERQPLVDGADIWITNLHKWVSASPGTAAIVAPDGSAIGPALRSWSGEEPFPDSFRWTGTDAKSSWLASPVALEIVDLLRSRGLDQRLRAILADVGEFLSADWGVEPDARPPGFRCPWMSLLEVPLAIPIEPSAMDRAMLVVRERLRADVALTPMGGRTYLRLSAYGYNDESQYERLRSLPDVLARTRN